MPPTIVAFGLAGMMGEDRRAPERFLDPIVRVEQPGHVLALVLGTADQRATMTICGTTRSWRCWRASWKRGARIVRQWPASRHSTGLSWAGRLRRAITR